MSALLGIIETDPLHAPTVLPRLEQLRLQADWMAIALRRETGLPAPTDVGVAVADAWAVEGQHAVCTVRLVREQVPLVLVDPVAVRRSVRNLIDNAVRAAGPTGQVEVRVGHTPGIIVVEVSDDGPGFGRVPAQQGLGLLTVRRFATSVGGSLTVGRSELGGAMVRLNVPVRATFVKGDSA